MSKTESGIIRAMSRNGKAFTLEANSDVWFSAFSPDQLNSATRGATVEFTYVEKSSGGRVFNNIKGQLKILNPGFGDAGDSDNSGALSASGKKVTFGEMTLSRDRCIARQNACNVMSNTLGEFFTTGELLTNEQVINIAQLIVEGAQVIEEYTTGDIDKKEAQQKLEDQEVENLIGTVPTTEE